MSKPNFSKKPTKLTELSDFWKDNVSLLLTEADKYKNDKKLIKELFNYYHQIGSGQLKARAAEYQAYHDLAEGRIRMEDFVETKEFDELQELDPTIKFTEDEVKIENFPIVPPILNRLEGTLDKKHIKFEVSASNSEAANEIIDARIQDVKSFMVKELEKSFTGKETPEEKQQTIEEKLSKYTTDYKLEIENWANHVINIEDNKFQMKDFTKKLFRENMITECPFAHIECDGSFYYPETIDAREAFYLKSKNASDASEYSMFGWEALEDMPTIINKYKLNDEQLKKVEKWHGFHKTGFIPSGQEMFDHRDPMKVSLQNKLTFDSVMSRSETSGRGESNPHHRLYRVTNMYLLIPKKVMILTTVINGKLYTEIVDDVFKVTEKPTYKYNKAIKQDLVSGEHVDCEYINELWKMKKIEFTFMSPVMRQNDDFEPIYLFLDKNPIQFKHRYLRYGVKIPIHGGHERGWSIVSTTYPWQRFYNYIGNRSKQILSSELGKFLLLNQNLIPENSFDGDWGTNNLIKFFLTAKELSLGPTDSSMSNMGEPQGNQGFGQVVDLEKTNDVQGKLNLMRTIKMECYDTLGLNPTFMGEVTPNQSAKSQAASQEQTLTQVQFLYTRIMNLMRMVRETMLETALYLTSKGEFRELTYLNSDQQRVIFSLGVENTLLYDLALYPKSDITDSIILETIKQIVVTDNTMGSDALEKSLMITATSTSELLTRLKGLAVERDKKNQQQQEHEQKMQQDQLAAQEKAMQMQMDNDNMNREKDRQSDLLEAQVKALGYAEGDAATISKEILALQSANLEQEALYQQYELSQKSHSLATQKLLYEQKDKKDELELQERMKLKEISLRERELIETAKRNSIEGKKAQAMIDNKKTVKK